MLNITADDSRSVAVSSAIHIGDIEGLERLLNDNPGLATSLIVNAQGVSRTLLHVATDWPGHFPNVAKTITALVASGSDVNAKSQHPSRQECQETPLHWAASSDDVAALDALLDYGNELDIRSRIHQLGRIIGPLQDSATRRQKAWRSENCFFK